MADDLIPKLVSMVQTGQLKEHDVWSRLTDEERKTYLANRLPSVEVMGRPIIPVPAGMAGMITSMIPTSLAGLGESIVSTGKAAIPLLGADYAMKSLGIPNDIRSAITMALGLKGGVAGAAESKIPTSLGAMTEDELAALITKGERNAAANAAGAKLRPPSAAPVPAPGPALRSARELDDVLERVQGGGGVSFENNGSTVRPNGPISMRKPAGVSGTGPDSSVAMPLNVERTRSAADDMIRAELTGGNADAAAHAAGGAMRKGVKVEGDNVYDAHQDAKVLKKVKRRMAEMKDDD